MSSALVTRRRRAMRRCFSPGLFRRPVQRIPRGQDPNASRERRVVDPAATGASFDDGAGGRGGDNLEGRVAAVEGRAYRR